MYPLVICYIAIENGHRNSGFSHERILFSIVMLCFLNICCGSMGHWCFEGPPFYKVVPPRQMFVAGLMFIHLIVEIS